MTIALGVEIRRVADGKTVSMVWPEWDWTDSFWWTEGNAACDCNRGNWFNEEIGDTSESECGNDRYEVRLTNKDTGEVLYNEFDDHDAQDAGEG